MQKSPFFWGPKQLGYYKSFGSSMQVAGSIIGIVILKKLLQLRDTTIIILAMATHVIEVIIIAFAKTAMEIYVAAAIGCLWSTAIPCLKSFMAQLVEAGEVGKAYILYSISITLGVLLSGIMYGGIYMATVAYFPSFAFLLAGGLELICIVAMIWLHFDHKKEAEIFVHL